MRVLADEIPPRKRIGQEDAGAFAFGIVQRHAEALQQQSHLQMCHNERRGHQFETIDPIHRRLFGFHDGQHALAFLFLDRLHDAAEHLDEIRRRAAAKI